MTLVLANQVRKMCDELIISEDGNPNEDLRKVSDKYLVHSRLGHADNLVEGIKQVTCDFCCLHGF